MADLVVVPAEVRIVRLDDIGQLADGPANEVVVAGKAVRIDGATGQYTPGNGTAAGEAGVRGIACNTGDYARATLTVMKTGILDIGDALSAVGYGDPIYLSDTDGLLSTTVGTVTVLVGHCIPAWGNTTADKLLLVHVP